MVNSGSTNSPTHDPRGVDLQHIRQVFRTRSGSENVALHDVSISIHEGEVVAVVGESGSGKSTLGLIAAGLLTPTSGQVVVGGQPLRYKRLPLKAHHRKVQLILQNPFSALNPVHTVLHHLARPLKLHREVRRPDELRQQASDLLTSVGLTPPLDYLDKYPHQLSGGQRQRVGIARALATEPQLIVADEPTSMLDVSLRLDMLNLLLNLRAQHHTSFLFITHDLASAHYIADRIAVLFRGTLVETGPAELVIRNPKHPYTQLLLEAITEVVPEDAGMFAMPPASVGGCLFRARCPLASERCETEVPMLRMVTDGTDVACHNFEQTGGQHV